MAKLNIIKVKSNLKPDKVALWEVHPQHPKSDKYPEGGEIFISGEQVFEVAETVQVQRAIKDQRLVRVNDKPAAKPADKPVSADKK